MKKLLLSSMLTLIFCQSYSQDLIVTTNGDSLNCKIKYRMSGIIHYKFSQGDKTYHSKLPKSDVKTYKYDFYNSNSTEKYLNDNGPKDLVLTQDGDSIRCKIVALKFNQLYYKVDSSADIKHLTEDQVKKYRFDYYHPFSNYQKWTLSFNGGYSRRLTEISKNLDSYYDDHIKQLKEGYHLEADFTYYFSEYLGVGAKCALFKASNSQTIVGPEIIVPYNSYEYGQYSWAGFCTLKKNVRVEDKHTIPYIGLMASARLYDSKKRGALLVNCSVGYLGYTDDGTYAGQSFTIKGNKDVDNYFAGYLEYTGDGTYTVQSLNIKGNKLWLDLDNYSAGYLEYTYGSYLDSGIYADQSFTIKGNTLGLALDFGYDYWFSRSMALGVRISLISGVLKECTKETAATKEYAVTTEKIKLTRAEYESLGRLDISVGLRFGK